MKIWLRTLRKVLKNALIVLNFVHITARDSLLTLCDTKEWPNTFST